MGFCLEQSDVDELKQITLKRCPWSNFEELDKVFNSCKDKSDMEDYRVEIITALMNATIVRGDNGEEIFGTNQQGNARCECVDDVEKYWREHGWVFMI